MLLLLRRKQLWRLDWQPAAEEQGPAGVWRGVACCGVAWRGAAWRGEDGVVLRESWAMARQLLCLASALVLWVVVSGGGPPVQRGYAASFQGPTAIAGIRAGQIDWDAPGWADLGTDLTWSAWVRYSPHHGGGCLFRIVTATNNYLFELQGNYAITSDN